MIGYLEGNIKHVDCDKCLLVCHGVGYEIQIHAKTASMTMGQTSFALYIHHHVREDGQLLFGFATSRAGSFSSADSVARCGSKAGSGHS